MKNKWGIVFTFSWLLILGVLYIQGSPYEKSKVSLEYSPIPERLPANSSYTLEERGKKSPRYFLPLW